MSSLADDLHRHYDEAYRLQAAGQVDRADAEFKLFLGGALHGVANAEANVGKYAQAEQSYEEAREFGPEQQRLLVDYASAMVDAKSSSKAELLVAEALEADQQRHSAGWLHLLLARALEQQSKSFEALARFREALGAGLNYERAYIFPSECRSAGDLKTAEDAFVALERQFGDTAAIHVKVGISYRDTGFYEPAIAEFQKALQKDPSLPEVHFFIGNVYLTTAGLSSAEAESEFRAEMKLHPASASGYLGLGQLRVNQRQYLEAEPYYKRAVVLAPGDATAYLALGEIETKTDRGREAIVMLRKGIALWKKSAEDQRPLQRAHYSLGRLLLEYGEAEKARRELERAAELSRGGQATAQTEMVDLERVIRHDVANQVNPGDLVAEQHIEQQMGPAIAGCFNSLGVNAATRGAFREAEQYFEHAAQWAPTLRGVDKNWGRAAFFAHDYAKATEPLKRALQAEPGDNEIRSMLAYTQR